MHLCQNPFLLTGSPVISTYAVITEFPCKKTHLCFCTYMGKKRRHIAGLCNFVGKHLHFKRNCVCMHLPQKTCNNSAVILVLQCGSIHSFARSFLTHAHLRANE